MKDVSHHRTISIASSQEETCLASPIEGYRPASPNLRRILAGELLNVIGEEHLVLSERSFVFKKPFTQADYPLITEKAHMLALRASSPYLAAQVCSHVDELQVLQKEVEAFNTTQNALKQLKPALTKATRALLKAARGLIAQSSSTGDTDILDKVVTIVETQCTTLEAQPLERAAGDISLLAGYLEDLEMELAGSSLQEKAVWLKEHLALFNTRVLESSEESTGLYRRYTETLCFLADTAFAEGGRLQGNPD